MWIYKTVLAHRSVVTVIVTGPAGILCAHILLLPRHTGTCDILLPRHSGLLWHYGTWANWYIDFTVYTEKLYAHRFIKRLLFILKSYMFTVL